MGILVMKVVEPEDGISGIPTVIFILAINCGFMVSVMVRS